MPVSDANVKYCVHCGLDAQGRTDPNGYGVVCDSCYKPDSLQPDCIYCGLKFPDTTKGIMDLANHYEGCEQA